MRWLLQSEEIAGKIIAFNGKTARVSKRGGERGIHILSAFLTDAQTVIGEIMCDEKSNEITALSELLDMVNVEKSIVTIDAMGCQSGIAKKISDKKADYCLALKGNQTSLHDDVKLYFEDLPAEQYLAKREKGHGQIERREYYLQTDIDWLTQRTDSARLNLIGAVRSTVLKRKIFARKRAIPSLR